MILGRVTYDCNMQCTTTNLNESNGKTPQKIHLTVIPMSKHVTVGPQELLVVVEEVNYPERGRNGAACTERSTGLAA